MSDERPVCVISCDRVRGQQRPRTTRSGHVYETRADKEWKRLIRSEWLAQVGLRYGSGPVAVRIDVQGRLPKSAPKSLVSQPNTFKPDADNVAKAVLDALNGVAYDDDTQVVELTVKKWNRARLSHEVLTIDVWEV